VSALSPRPWECRPHAQRRLSPSPRKVTIDIMWAVASLPTGDVISTDINALDIWSARCTGAAENAGRPNRCAPLGSQQPGQCARRDLPQRPELRLPEHMVVRGTCPGRRSRGPQHARNARLPDRTLRGMALGGVTVATQLVYARSPIVAFGPTLTIALPRLPVEPPRRPFFSQLVDQVRGSLET
jgi:hypothetical protein